MGFRIIGESGQVEAPPSPTQYRVDYQATGYPFKRAFDICFSLLALIFVAPLILVVAMIVRLHDGGPAFYSQKRVGKDGRTFNFYKLRSMVVDSQAQLEALMARDPEARREYTETHKLRNDPRITPIGKFIRKSSIDELPQLWNILIGDMSVVGPRPVEEFETYRYGDDYKHYCSGAPGLTGLWQISGRNDISFQQRVDLDVHYVKNQSLSGDIFIILKTVPAVLKSSGAV
ncbi:MAG: hypothetical protein Hens3KO_19260 [Henriciella sp.]